VLIGARTVDAAADRFTMGYRIVSLGQNAIAADGTGVIVAYDYTANRKVPLPADVRAGVLALTGE
jgi:acyl-CoA thioester hydrolase